MVDVHITRGTPAQRLMVYRVVSWCASELMSKRTANKLCIDITIHNKLDSDGYSYGLYEDDGTLDLKELSIDVLIKPAPMDTIITLCHEMVHIRQMVTSQVVEVFEPMHRKFWEGEDYTDVEYSEQPWEIEAFSLETALADKFLAEKGL